MLFRRIGFICLIALAIAVAAAPAFAGKGGNGGGNSGSGGSGGSSGSGGSGSSTTTSSSISIATVDGVSAASTKDPAPALADTVTFNTTASGMAGSEYPMVDLQCFQDVNGDGTVDTSLSGPDVVFTSLDTPAATFTMGGYASIWTLRGGGTATCVAKLEAYGWKGGVESIRVLASTKSWAAAG
jgi:hypothetical protein